MGHEDRCLSLRPVPVVDGKDITTETHRLLFTLSLRAPQRSNKADEHSSSSRHFVAP